MNAPFKRPNKYGAKKTVVDGITFDSQAEARRYGSLKMLEKLGRISGLELQPKFDLRGVNDGHVCFYKADFRYYEHGADGMMLGRVVEDVKSPITAKESTYRLKIKLLKENFPNLDFREVKG